MMRNAFVAAGFALAATVAPLSAQTLASRIDAVKNGTVVFTYAARPDVCGDGDDNVHFSGRDWHDDRWRCSHGPVVVRLERADGRTVHLRARVAFRPIDSAATDLGTIAPEEAAHYLLDVARQDRGSVSRAAITAAAMADVHDLGGQLVPIVQDERMPLESRKQALFWAGQSELSTADLIRLGDPLHATELRDHYVFVLSQRRDDTAVGALITLARNDPSEKVRKHAMFWLGQSRDPKAVQFFRDVLTR